MASEPLVIRADASSQMGTGHVMRCLALAQAWEDEGIKALFVSAESVPTLSRRLTNEGMRELLLPETPPGSLVDAQKTAALAKKVDARWIVLDGYHFGSDYQKYLKDVGHNLLVWDDNGHADHYYADFILNQNIHANASMYANREPKTQLLLGTSYAVLRREFWPWRNWKREIPTRVHNILVTMGGSDSDNITLKVIRALQQIEYDDLQSIIVVGGSNPHYPLLKAAIEDGDKRFQLRRNVEDMPSLMAWADIAISAAGSTCWELAFMGVPTLLLVSAENQKTAASLLHKENVAVNLGSGKQADSHSIAIKTKSLVSNSHLRQELSFKGKNLVDGFGIKRVIMALDESLQMEER